jgi:uncharacterized membrane protein YbhN (UPF0104 family)
VVLAPPLLNWLRRWSQHRLWQALLSFGEQVAASLRVLVQQPRRGALVTVESLYIWLCDALVVWCVLHSLGAALPLDVAAFVALTVDVLAAAPLTPGGIGQIDAAYVALFALLPATAFNVGRRGAADPLHHLLELPLFQRRGDAAGRLWRSDPARAQRRRSDEIHHSRDAFFT